MISCSCHECGKITRCLMVTRDRHISYLCRPCARALGYLPREAEDPHALMAYETRERDRARAV